MKKAKVMLTAICIFAVVGGALAFKETKKLFIEGSTPGLCNVQVQAITTTPGTGSEVPVRLSSGTCTTTTYTIFTED